MDHFKNIYSNMACEYHRMIEYEDVDGNLYDCIDKLLTSDVSRVLDIGSGTGRIPLLLSDPRFTVVGLDLYWEMLQENVRQRSLSAGSWLLSQGSAGALPMSPDCFDVLTAGWVLGHTCSWHLDWQTELDIVLKEMHRVVRDQGVIIIMETLTTGSVIPSPPTAELANYYDWLENSWAFSRQEIRTDYRFPDVKEAISNTEFFFGEQLSSMIVDNNWSRVPECTGIWSKIV